MVITGKTLEAIVKIAGKAEPSLSKSFKVANGVIKGAASTAAKCAKKMAAVTTAAAGAATAATAAVAVKAVNAAADYEKAFAKTTTLLSGSKEQIQAVSDDIIKLSNKTGIAANELTETVYNAISAGVSQDKAVEFAGKASKLAAGGFTDASTAVDVLTTAINAYGLSADDASQISDYLITTQNLGKTTVDELAASVGKVIPVASAYGVNMDNLSAAYARLTAGGIATAESGTYLKAMLLELGDSGSTVSEKLKEQTGQSFAELTASGKSLGDVIAILGDSVGNNAGAFTELWQKSTAGIGALSLLNSGAEKYNETLTAMQESGGATEKAAGTMADTYEKQLKIIKNLGTNFMISIGQKIMPYARQLLEKMLPKLQDAIENVLPLIDKVIAKIGPIFEKVQKKIGPLIEQLRTDLEPLFSNISSNAGPIFDNIVGAVGEIIPLIKDIIKESVPFIKELVENLKPVISSIISVVQKALPSIMGLIRSLVPLILQVTAALMPLVDSVIGFISDILPTVINLVNELAPVITRIISVIVSTLTPVISAISDGIKPIIEQISNLITTIIPLLNAAIDGLAPIIQGVVVALAEACSGIMNDVSAVISNITGMIEGILSFIVDVFEGDWSAAWKDIEKIGENLICGIVNTLTTPINSLIGGINACISGVNGINIDIPDWVPGVGGEKFSLDIPLIPTIPKLAKGGFTNGVSIAGEAGTEAVISFDPTYRQQNLENWAKAGRMLGASDGELLSLLDNAGSHSDGIIQYNMGGIEFKPQITINGNADKQDIIEAIREAEPEFMDMLEELLSRRRREVYG